MPVSKRKKLKPKMYILCMQDSNGQIQQVLSSENYDLLLVEGLEICKETKLFYTIFDTLGREIDSNFNKRKEK